MNFIVGVIFLTLISTYCFYTGLLFCKTIGSLKDCKVQTIHDRIGMGIVGMIVNILAGLFYGFCCVIGSSVVQLF